MLRWLTVIGLIISSLFTLPAFAGTWVDDFEDGNLDDWVIGAGEWNVRDGKLSCINKGGVSTIWMEPSEWRDYTFEASVCLVQRFFLGQHEMSLCVRANPQNQSCYGFALQFAGVKYVSDQLQINRIINPVTVGHLMRKDYEISENTWYTLKGSVMGNHLSFYVNDELHLQFEDPIFRSGTVGIYVSGVHILIDDVVITGDDVPDGGSLQVMNVRPRSKLAVMWGEVKSN